MGMLRKSAAERREVVLRLIAEREASGESWRSISARTGINYATLAGWVWRLRRETTGSERSLPTRSAFIELVSTDATDRNGAIELVLRGERRLRIAAGFDASTLTRLVRALEAC